MQGIIMKHMFVEMLIGLHKVHGTKLLVATPAPAERGSETSATDCVNIDRCK